MRTSLKPLRAGEKLVGGFNPSLKNVNWDHDIPNWMESHNPFHGSSHHQAVIINHH